MNASTSSLSHRSCISTFSQFFACVPNAGMCFPVFTGKSFQSFHCSDSCKNDIKVTGLK